MTKSADSMPASAGQFLVCHRLQSVVCVLRKSAQPASAGLPSRNPDQPISLNCHAPEYECSVAHDLMGGTV
ncbi:MAG: hypothetical protein ACE5EQ_08175 [Phycisphaerae bacterium]